MPHHSRLSVLLLSLFLGLPLAACLPGIAPGPPANKSERSQQGTRDQALPSAATQVIPLPTEHRLGKDAESQQQGARLRWIEELHKSPPDVDWREVERRNQAAELARRNELAQTGAPAAALWEEVGSSNQSGHMRCTAIGPEREGEHFLYAGSAHGGLWRADLDGNNWTPLSDNLYGGIDDVLALAPTVAADPDILVVRRGNDIHRSADNGATWIAPSGLTGVTSIIGMLLLPDTEQTIVLLTKTPGAGVGSKVGIHASTDGGLSFQSRWQNLFDWSADFWVPRIGSEAGNTIYVLQRGRIHRSIDKGYNFNVVGDVDTAASAGKLAGSEAGSPTLYAAVQVSGTWQLHRSDNGGANFQHVETLADFWGALSAFPSQANVVVYGGVEAFRSGNGGQTFVKINNWGAYYGAPLHNLHADIRGIQVHDDPRTTFPADLGYFCTDGGVYDTIDWASNVRNLSLHGLGVGQFYTTHTSINDPDLILGGTQDQGYQRGYKLPSTGAGPSSPFDQLISGDYGHLTSSDGGHAWIYCTYPGFILGQQGELNPSLFTLSFPSTAHSWLPPVVADPINSQTFFFLGAELHRFVRNSGSWSSSQHSAQSFANPGSYLSAMAFAPTDFARAYACNNNGRLWTSSDHALTWTESSDTGPGAHYFYGSTIVVHPTNHDEAVVAGSGYSGAGVRRTTNAGLTWQPIVSGLPNTMVYDVTYAGDGSGDLFAATETGAYRWDRSLSTWMNIMQTVAPATTYWTVEAVTETGIIRFGTYGRGIWDYVLPGDGLPGSPYCSCTIPTCGNPSTEGGCANSTGNGALLAATGETYPIDSVTLHVTGATPGQFAILFQGDNVSQLPFGDGELCATGDIRRFSGVLQLDLFGALSFGPLNGDPSISSLTGVRGGSGSTKRYQFWYRDPTGPCGTGFNLSNGYQITW